MAKASDSAGATFLPLSLFPQRAFEVSVLHCEEVTAEKEERFIGGHSADDSFFLP